MNLPVVVRDILAWTFLVNVAWFVLTTVFWGVYQWKIVDQYVPRRPSRRERLLDGLVLYFKIAFFPWSYLGIMVSGLIYEHLIPRTSR